jgi:hypothetical protein
VRRLLIVLLFGLVLVGGGNRHLVQVRTPAVDVDASTAEGVRLRLG